MVKNEVVDYIAANFYKVSDCYWVSWDKRDMGIYCWEGLVLKAALNGVKTFERSEDNKEYERLARKHGYMLTYRKGDEAIVIRKRSDGSMIATWVILGRNSMGDRVIKVGKRGFCLADESAIAK